MKKVIIIAASLMGSLASTLVAQGVFDKGTTTLNLGVGLGGYVNYWGAGYSATPYINTALDYSVYEFPDVKGLSIGIGGYLGWRRVSYSFVDSWKDKNGVWHYNQPVKSIWNYTAFGVRGTLHYSFNDKAEVYGGLPIGYVMVNHKYSEPEYGYYFNYSYGSYVGYGFLVGGRYFFTNSFGGYLELGYGISYLNLGISLKF